jgi:lysozyme family protein
LSDPIFDRAFDLVIGSEGGYVNDPRDPGGETKFGISKRAYPDVSIADLDVLAAKAIYMKDYFVRVGAEGQQFFKAYVLFDSAVLHGVSWALHFNSLCTQKNSPNWQEEFLTARAMAEREDRNWATYGKGWTERLIRVALQSLLEAP